MKRHINIPIFIPHLGCPNMCVFCNQRTISGVVKFDINDVKSTINDALTTVHDDDDVEIAFFGGSFTGIDRELMISLLMLAHEYVTEGKVRSIRCSTRPDYIDEETLDILERYSVKVIELGLQSIDDTVLKISKRGHDRAAAERACRMITKRGFSLVGQMMIGLPGSNKESELETADFIINSGAVAARIYPTAVFRETELCNMALRGEYQPLSESEAIERTAEVFLRLKRANINIIRVGLCASDNLSDESMYYAGPNHPALGELVENSVYLKITEREIKSLGILKDAKIIVSVSRGALSKAIGQNRKNKNKLIEQFLLKDIKYKEDDTVREYTVRVCREER